MRKLFRNLLHDPRGTSAVEFAFVGPMFMMCMVGLVYVGMALFSQGSLQYAVEQSSRCWAISATGCTSTATAQTYASGVYYGPTDAPTFTASSQTCGYQVKGSVNFKVQWVLGSATVPLSAVACFP